MNTKQAVTNDSNNLPPFNQVIKIEVEVQSIYEKLLSTFPEDYKHKEMLAHAIIGSSEHNGGLNYVYNALNGFTNDVNFKVGDFVDCTEKNRVVWYDSIKEDENGLQINSGISDELVTPKWKSKNVMIGKCRVIDINLYRSDKIMVEFVGSSLYRREEGETTKAEWVNQKTCEYVDMSVE